MDDLSSVELARIARTCRENLTREQFLLVFRALDERGEAFQTNVNAAILDARAAGQLTWTGPQCADVFYRAAELAMLGGGRA